LISFSIRRTIPWQRFPIRVTLFKQHQVQTAEDNQDTRDISAYTKVGKNT